MKKHNTIKVVLLVVTALLLVASFVLPDKNWAHLVKGGLALVELVLLLLNAKENSNTTKGVLVTILVFMALTWILPAAYYSSGFVDQGRVQIGLFDIFNYPLTVMDYFGYISLFILAVGAFYGVLYKIPAYRTFLDKVVALFKGKEFLAITIMMVVISALVSIGGLQLALLMFFPMFVAIILLLGYDKVVAALTLVGSTVVGLAGTTFAYANTAVLYDVLGLDIMDNILVRVLVLVAGLVLLVFNTLVYARRSRVVTKSLTAEKTVIKTEEVKEEVVTDEAVDEKASAKEVKKSKTNNKKPANKKVDAKKPNGKKPAGKKSSSKSSRKDIKAASKGDEVIVVKESLNNDSLERYVPTVVDSKHKIWPIVVMFGLLFVIMVLAFLPWEQVFKVTVFSEASSEVAGFKLFGFDIFGKLLGTFESFGNWTLLSLMVVMAVFALLLSYIYKIKFDEVLDGISSGAKKALTPAFLTFLIYMILVLVTFHPFQTTIYEALFGLTEGFNTVTTAVAGFLSSIFNADASYVYQAVVPHFAGVVTNSDIYPIAGILFQSMYGVAMLVAPTSVVLVATLSYLGISFKDWYKAIWKLLIELVVVLLLIYTILIVLL